MTIRIHPELEAQYNLRALRPDFERGMLQQWLARSAAFRSATVSHLDLAYGPDERERIDYFPAGTPGAPLLIFFHGGFWQRGDKAVYSFVAEPFVAHGVSVALVNYTLCPAASVDGIVAQAQRALAWLWRHAGELSCSRERWLVSGHSAGGQIAARMMATQWPELGDDLPRHILSGAVLVSALFDLEPLCATTHNEGLRMSLAQARAASPLRHPPVDDAPQLLAVGGAESREFHRQADDYAQAFATAKRAMPRYRVDACDHFDVLQALAEPAHPFFQDALAFIHAR